GDAIGSLLGLSRALREAGRDVILWHADPDPVPDDLRFLLADGETISADVPADAAGWTLVALDCATAERIGDPVPTFGDCVVNVDHHHDNTRFGDVNYVDPEASSTAEVVTRLLGVADVPLTLSIAEPLFVGIVTDTGQFSYSNARASAFHAAGRLVAFGIDLGRLSRHLFEDEPIGRARLVGRAVDRVNVRCNGAAVWSILDTADLADTGTDDTNGAVEALGAIRGVRIAALVRAATSDDSIWRVSLRARDDVVDVSAIAREQGGGGHRAAAGCTVDGTRADVVSWLEAAIHRAL
ncbi:MAG: DHH family phosphoesterase, partial [Actinobacteria bacterium]|nr:DHH family phosphoesterase [Actinomycetota bacterium]